jgi:SAM-dependent methyltransferase
MGVDQYLSGSMLYGDDLAPREIERWYAQEEQGFYKLATEFYKLETSGSYSYEYDALNAFHGFDRLQGRRFGTCVALGCAAGDDVAPLARQVERFVGIEPAETWWTDTIGGRPARFIKPQPSGDIALPEAGADLFVSLGVLHHIPNVSHVLAEAHRILEPGGLVVLREPITSMGDWTRARYGLTRNERGLPLPWLRGRLDRIGFEILHEAPCMTNALAKIAQRVLPGHLYARRGYVALDAAVSRFLAFNISYHRTALLRRIAPSNIFLVAAKR